MESFPDLKGDSLMDYINSWPGIAGKLSIETIANVIDTASRKHKESFQQRQQLSSHANSKKTISKTKPVNSDKRKPSARKAHVINSRELKASLEQAGINDSQHVAIINLLCKDLSDSGSDSEKTVFMAPG